MFTVSLLVARLEFTHSLIADCENAVVVLLFIH
jgi:hypothetical protein